MGLFIDISSLVDNLHLYRKPQIVCQLDLNQHKTLSFLPDEV